MNPLLEVLDQAVKWYWIHRPRQIKKIACTQTIEEYAANLKVNKLSKDWKGDDHWIDPDNDGELPERYKTYSQWMEHFYEIDHEERHEYEKTTTVTKYKVEFESDFEDFDDLEGRHYW